LGVELLSGKTLAFNDDPSPIIPAFNPAAALPILPVWYPACALHFSVRLVGPRDPLSISYKAFSSLKSLDSLVVKGVSSESRLYLRLLKNQNTNPIIPTIAREPTTPAISGIDAALADDIPSAAEDS